MCLRVDANGNEPDKGTLVSVFDQLCQENMTIS